MARRTFTVAASTAVVVAGLALVTPVAAEAGRLITGNDIKDGSVTTADVANGSLKKKDFAQGVLPADGQQGEQGPSGVVASVSQPGPAVAPKTSLAFVAPTARVTVSTGQSVFVTSSAALGADAAGNGARALELDVCYQELGGTIARIGVGVTGLSAPPSHQNLFTLSASKSDLPPASYDLGLCGSTVALEVPDWNLTGGGQTTVQVFAHP